MGERPTASGLGYIAGERAIKEWHEMTGGTYLPFNASLDKQLMQMPSEYLIEYYEAMNDFRRSIESKGQSSKFSALCGHPLIKNLELRNF